MRRAILLFVALLMGMSSLAHGAQALEALQGPIDEVISLLKDPHYQEAAQKDLQREKIWEIIREVFDFAEIGKRAVARNWKSFTHEQKREFTDVFGEFLGNTYLDKIQGEYRDEEVVYLGQESISDSKALVRTKIVRETVEFNVDYSMKMHTGTWKIYDVKVEGVSLVKNYRAQFRQILARESPDQLIARLKKKLNR